MQQAVTQFAEEHKLREKGAAVQQAVTQFADKHKLKEKGAAVKQAVTQFAKERGLDKKGEALSAAVKKFATKHQLKERGEELLAKADRFQKKHKLAEKGGAVANAIVQFAEEHDLKEKGAAVKSAVESFAKKHKLVERGKEAAGRAVEAMREFDEKHHVQKYVTKGVAALKKMWVEKVVNQFKDGGDLEEVGNYLEDGWAEVENRFDIQQKVEDTLRTGKETIELGVNMAEVAEAVATGDMGFDELSSAKKKFVNRFSRMAQNGYKKFREGAALRSIMLERLDNIKRGIKDTLKEEIEEGAREALHIVKEHSESTRGLSWELAIPSAMAPMMLKGTHCGYELAIYLMIPEVVIMTMLMLINLNDQCSYNLNYYIWVRIGVDVVYVCTVWILRGRLNAWFAKNNGWEASPESARDLMSRETAEGTFGVTSTGKATLYFYDMEYESCCGVFASAVMVPIVTMMNIALIVLMVQWSCQSCDKTMLVIYVYFLAGVYMVSLLYHLTNLTLRISITMAYCNCCCCCRSCLKSVAKYIDSGLPNPIFYALVKHVLLRESLVSEVSKTRLTLRRRRQKLRSKIKDLETRIDAKRAETRALDREDARLVETRDRVAKEIKNFKAFVADITARRLDQMAANDDEKKDPPLQPLEPGAADLLSRSGGKQTGASTRGTAADIKSDSVGETTGQRSGDEKKRPIKQRGRSQ